MKAEELAALLNELPDEMIVSACTARYEKPRHIRMYLPTAAVITAALTAAALYPLLRTEKPQILPEGSSAVVTETTTGTGITTGTEPALTTSLTQSAQSTLSANLSSTLASGSVTASTTSTTALVSLQTTGSAQSGTTDSAGSSASTTAEFIESVVGPDVPETTGSSASISECTITSISEYTTICDTTIELHETTRLTEGAGNSFETPVPCCVLSQSSLNADPQHLSKGIEATFFRDRLPDGYSSDELPEIDFATEDYVLVRTQTVGRGAESVERVAALGSRYSLMLYLPALPEGEVCELQIAIVLPRSVQDSGGFSYWWFRTPSAETDAPKCILNANY